MDNVKIDVLIPTYKPNVSFGNMVKRLLKQTVQLNKIIVINTEEQFWNSEFEAITEKLEVHHISKEEFGHGSSRNKAASFSKADVIIFMTQDAKPYDKYLIERLVKPFSEDEKIWCTYARQLATGDCMEIERYTRIYNYPRQSHVRSKADIDKYLASSLGSYDLAGTDRSIYGGKEEFIAAQKWLSLLWVGWEQFHEWRRNEYPVLTIGEGTVYNDHELPTRFVYPSYTVSSNKLNVENALSRMSGDNSMHTPLDWSWKKLTGSHRNPYGVN